MKAGYCLIGLLCIVCVVFSRCGKSSSSDMPDVIPTVATPEISPGGGNYSSTQYVGLTCETGGVTIRYTTDGSNPSEYYGAKYSGTKIAISNSQTIKAIAYKDGYTASRIASQEYTIASTVSNPFLSLSGGYYASTQHVKITCPSSGVSIRYTTDGNDPSRVSGNLYAGESIPLARIGSSPRTIKVKAIAYNDSCESSVIQTEYTITGSVSAPEITVSAVNSSDCKVNISNTYSFMTPITVYTIDGSVPSRTHGNIYSISSVISVPSSCTIQAFSYIPAWSETSDSEVVKTVLSPTGQALAPAIETTGTREGDCFYGSVTITLSTETIGGIIRYKDSTVDDEGEWKEYTEPFTLTYNDSTSNLHTISAYTTKSGYSDSAAISSQYTITTGTHIPLFSKESGYYTDSFELVLSCDTDGAEIFYTKDGSDPKNTPTIDPSTGMSNIYLYTGPISLAKGDILDIKAYAKRTGCQESQTIEKTYAVTGKLPALVITPSPSGESSINPLIAKVSFDSGSGSSVTGGNVVVVYTDDGSSPQRLDSEGNTVSTTKKYNADNGIFVGASSPEKTTVKVLAYVPQWESSSESTLSEEYDVARTVFCSGTIVNGETTSAVIWKSGKVIPLISPSLGITTAGRMCDDGVNLYVSGTYVDSGHKRRACGWKIDANMNQEFIRLPDDSSGFSSPPSTVTETTDNSYAGNAIYGGEYIYFTGYAQSSYSGQSGSSSYIYPACWRYNRQGGAITISPIKDRNKNFENSYSGIVEKGGICWTMAVDAKHNVLHESFAGSLTPPPSTDDDLAFTEIPGMSYENKILRESYFGTENDFERQFEEKGLGDDLETFNRTKYRITDMLNVSDSITRNLYAVGFHDSDEGNERNVYVRCWKWQLRSVSFSLTTIVSVTDPITHEVTSKEVSTPYTKDLWVRTENNDAVWSPLPSPGSIKPYCGTSSSIIGDDNKFYIAGYRKLASGKFSACYWTGTPDSWACCDLFAGSLSYDTYTTGICTQKLLGSSPTIYISGYEVQNSKNMPCIWFVEGTSRQIRKLGIDATGNFNIESVVVRDRN